MKFKITILILFISFLSFSQNSIKGKAVDKEGIPLYGVTILIKNNRYTTDFTGEFNIKYAGEYPVDLAFNYVGFKSQTITLYKAGDGKNVLVQLLEPKSNSLSQVVVAASRKEEKKIETPATIETFSADQIKNGTAADYYNGLENIKETQFNTGSFIQKTINTRGFATANNGRFLQVVDGAETTVPALSASIGNLFGLNELDVESIEVLPGTSSALYGANAFNGMLFMNSISPFKKSGVSAYYKKGVTNQKIGGTNFYDDFGLRVAVKFSKVVAAKLNVNYFAGTDWIADDQTHQGVLAGVLSSDAKYFDGINSYGDESIKYSPITGIVNRTGYKEVDLTNNKMKTIKLDGSLHIKASDNFDIILQQKLSIATTNYMDVGTKYAFKDFILAQSKMELKSKNFTSRSYLSLNDAGNSYSLTRAAINLNNYAKSDVDWFADFTKAFVFFYKPDNNDITKDLANKNAAYISARKYADYNDKSGSGIEDASGSPRLVPGTLAYQQALEKSQKETDSKNGSKLKDQSAFANQDLNYNFRDLIKFAEFQIGGSYRLYYLNSGGTIFTDKEKPISYSQYGGFTQVQKQLIDDRLKLTASVRYDKVSQLKGNFSPKISSNFSIGEKRTHNIRLSYQTGFRNPTSQDLYYGSDYGLITLLGSGIDNLERYKEIITQDGKTYTITGDDVYNKSFSYSSVLDFVQATESPTSFEKLKIEKINPVKQEKIQSFELGYRGTIAGISFDINGYINKYSDFIYSKRVVLPFENDPTGYLGALALLNSNSKAFQVYTNANVDLESRGVGVGLDRNFGKFNINASYNFAQLMDFDTKDDSDFVPDFNTPKHKAKLSLSHPRVFENFGFSTNVRWNSEYVWNSPFANGIIPVAIVVDAQVNLTLPSLKGIFKIGANNMLGKDYFQVIGAGQIGQQYYASFTYNL